MLKHPVHSLSHATVGNAFYLRQNRIFVYFTLVFHRMKLVKARNTAQEYVILGGNRQESWIFLEEDVALLSLTDASGPFAGPEVNSSKKSVINLLFTI